jgi:hypothetical protein
MLMTLGAAADSALKARHRSRRAGVLKDLEGLSER